MWRAQNIFIGWNDLNKFMLTREQMNFHVPDTWPHENLPNVVEGKEIGHRQTVGEHKDLKNYEKQGGKATAFCLRLHFHRRQCLSTGRE